MLRKYGSSPEPGTAAEFADAHIEVAENLPNDPAAALEQLKEAFKYDERQSIIARAFAIAKDVSDPLLRIDFYSFVATHAANDGQKNHAIEAAAKALAEVATKGVCEQRPSTQTIDAEDIARRTLDIFSILSGNFGETFGLRSQLMEIWHTQISTLMAQDEAAGTFRTRTFLGREIVRRAVAVHDVFTIGVLNGAFSRVMGDVSDASATAPVKSKAHSNADAARERLIAKAWHGAGANPSGQRYQ